MRLHNADDIPLPEGVFQFTDIVKRANNYVRNVVFPEFYSRLEICDSAGVNLNQCITDARRIIFSGIDSTDVPRYTDMFNEQDIADMLCGFMDFVKETGKRQLMQKSRN